ncbi:hepatic lectin [Xenopus laevis]|uniref:Hepatic lectin n=2 Tax=Xenopus laevis TaxID=8355 RepID=A0A1L8H2L6_XENLA|nr:hepatic lectin [Xenopus laevis]OCT90316.1 hypothetical protein XELAEV_18018928mg [Xenopus laevis]
MDRGKHEAYANFPNEMERAELTVKMRQIYKELKEGERRQRRLLMVLVPLLLFIFISLIILSLRFIYYSRVSEAVDDIKKDILQTIRKKNGQCDPGWRAFGGSCYYIVSEMTWTDAQTFCKKLNSNLVIINSEMEQNFLESIANRSDVWIGLRRAQRNEWRWVDGTIHNVSDGFWMKGEPFNAGGKEDCVHILLGRKWNDRDCTFEEKSFCEK